jgi:hypothetical protein
VACLSPGPSLPGVATHKHNGTIMALRDHRLKLAEFARDAHVVNAELNDTPEDLLKQQYWANVAGKIKPLDLIEVRAEDGSFYAQLLVRDKGRSWAKVVFLPGYPLVFKDIVDVPGMDLDEFVVKWAGPEFKFRVLRKTDNEVLKAGFTNKEEARKWVIEYIKSLAR